MKRHRASLRSVLRRNDSEWTLLEALSEAPCGLTLGQIRDILPDGAVTLLGDLVSCGRVRSSPGLIYSITEIGRARLAPTPPVCVAAQA